MGSIDLSMEGTVSVSPLCIFAFVVPAHWAGHWPLLPGLAHADGCLIVGAIIGFINGLVHVKTENPELHGLARHGLRRNRAGFALLLTGGDRIRIEDELFRSLLTVRMAELPDHVLRRASSLFVLIAWFIQSRTTLGPELLCRRRR